MTKLLVGTALPDLDEAMLLQDFDNFARFENRDRTHPSGHLNLPYPNELRFQPRFAVLKEHGHYFPKIAFHLFHICALSMSTRPARDVSDIQSSVRIPFYNEFVGFHREVRRLQFIHDAFGDPERDQRSSSRGISSTRLQGRVR